MSFTLIDKLQEHVCNAILYAADDVIEDYKLNFLKMPVEVSRLDFFHPSHHEDWVNPHRYCDFVRQKMFWSGDHFISGMPTRRFWKGICSQREQRESYPLWKAAHIARVIAAGAPPPQVAEQVIAISSDDDEESISEIIRKRDRRWQKQKQTEANHTIVISSDSDEPLIIIPRKRKTGESSKARRTKYQKIFIGDQEVIELDSDGEMTVVG